MGFPVGMQNEDITFFPLEGTWLSLYPKAKLAEDIGISTEGTGFSGVTLAHNVGSKEEVVEVLALAEKSGGTIIKQAQDVFWGGHSGYFTDPEENLWEVAWNPHEDLT